jgi:hypothetical protein
MKVEKTTIELYRIRLDKGGWADITMDDNGNAGRISIASDWGSWERFWGACGSSFKQFISTLDIHYTASKFGEDRFTDVEKTLKLWKTEVLERRKEEDISRQDARVIYDQIKELEENCDSSSLVSACQHMDELLDFFDYCPDFTTCISPTFQAFWDKIFVPFKNHLKEEIESRKPKSLPDAGYSVIP